MKSEQARYLFNEVVNPTVGVGNHGDGEGISFEEISAPGPLWGALIASDIPVSVRAGHTTHEPELEKRRLVAAWLRDWANSIEGVQHTEAMKELEEFADGEKLPTLKFKHSGGGMYCQVGVPHMSGYALTEHECEEIAKAIGLELEFIHEEKKDGPPEKEL